MKQFLTLAVCLVTAVASAQDHSLSKIWETDSVVAVPESVLPDFKNNRLYVSLIDGGPWDADAKGGVARLSADGKNYEASWVSGLNAPKGMGQHGNRLYVADIGDVVVIDMSNGKIIKKIAIEGASGLNDLTVSDKGIVYVSDSRTSKIWRIEKDRPTLFLDDVKGANGLRAVKDEVIFAQGKSLMKADSKKQVTKSTDVLEGIDGIEPIGNGDFITTSWVGYIYYVYADGRYETLLDTREQKKNAADIGYDPVKKIVYVPTFMGKTVAAYQLK